MSTCHRSRFIVPFCISLLFLLSTVLLAILLAFTSAAFNVRFMQPHEDRYAQPITVTVAPIQVVLDPITVSVEPLSVTANSVVSVEVEPIDVSVDPISVTVNPLSINSHAYVTSTVLFTQSHEYRERYFLIQNANIRACASASLCAVKRLGHKGDEIYVIGQSADGCWFWLREGAWVWAPSVMKIID